MIGGQKRPTAASIDRPQYVFGASGAAAFFRRDFIEDVSVEGEFFDEDFFAFREDGDLAWRAQVMGWKCLYTPAAVAWHVRRVTPERRKNLPLVINWHSVKNRFLMRGKNASGWLCWRLFLPVAWRDMMTFGYALLRDQRMCRRWLIWWKVRTASAASAPSFSRAAGFLTGICYGGSAILRAHRRGESSRRQWSVVSRQLSHQ